MVVDDWSELRVHEDVGVLRLDVRLDVVNWPTSGGPEEDVLVSNAATSVRTSFKEINSIDMYLIQQLQPHSHNMILALFLSFL